MKPVVLPAQENRRCGATLVELLIVMSVLAVVLTTSTTMLYRLLHAQSAGTTELAESLTISRLAHDLRRDAHAAQTAALAAAGNETTLTLTGGPLGDAVYTTNGHSLRRLGATGDGASTAEEYRLGGVTVNLELMESNRLAVVRLRADVADLQSTAGQSQPLQHRPPTVVTIEAAVGVGR